MIIRMKKIFNLMFAATLIGAVNVLSSFKMACDDQETANRTYNKVIDSIAVTVKGEHSVVMRRK